MITYVKDQGILVILNGLSVMLPLTMSVGALANHVAELREFYGPSS